MIPPKSDPIWLEIVDRPEQFEVVALPTKMLLMRVKFMRLGATAQSLENAIDSAFDFFSKNQDAVYEDIELIFGEQPKLDRGNK